jgi:hypothetical protein
VTPPSVLPALPVEGDRPQIVVDPATDRAFVFFLAPSAVRAMEAEGSLPIIDLDATLTVAFDPSGAPAMLLVRGAAARRDLLDRLAPLVETASRAQAEREVEARRSALFVIASDR